MSVNTLDSFTKTFLISSLVIFSMTYDVAASDLPVPEKAQDTEKQSKDEAVSAETVERELEAGEDPLQVQTSELHEKPGFWSREHTSLNPYGSVRYRFSGDEEESGLSDAGSRIGLSGEAQFRQRFWFLARAELGFTLFESLGELYKASGRLKDADETISTRLLYAGISTPSTTLTYGKNWSSYYQVSGLTDRFENFGGEASGTYNAQSDGGATGTGRANEVLQARLSIDPPFGLFKLKPFKLNLQYQAGQTIPHTDEEYRHSLGLSALLETKNDNFLGIAYNHAFIDEIDLSELQPQGIDGDAQALILGSRRFSDNYYIATTVSWLENHETTDEGVYFDGWGWEAFASYKIAPRWWVLGGWNALEPNSDQQQAGDYRLRYGVLGLRYTFDEFRKMVYSEIRLDNSYNADGYSPGNIYSIGVRWDLP